MKLRRCCQVFAAVVATTEARYLRNDRILIVTDEDQRREEDRESITRFLQSASSLTPRPPVPEVAPSTPSVSPPTQTATPVLATLDPIATASPVQATVPSAAVEESPIATASPVQATVPSANSCSSVSELTATVSDPVLVSQSGTAQNKASQWLEQLFLECPTPAHLEPYALAVFYESSNGAAWAQDTSWLDTANVCSWFGIVCDESGKVSEIRLANNNLTGTLPDELSVLESLTAFDTFDNSISGTFPVTLSWQNLRVLDIEENFLEGPAFPDNVMEMSNLVSYRVSTNLLTGQIEDLSGLVSLEELWIAKNAISGSIPPSIGNTTNLGSIVAYGNRLEGSLPSELGLLNLTDFQVHDNNLNGTVPSEFYNNRFLKDLRLERNQFSGGIDPAIGNLLGLKALRVGDNAFSGELPPQLTALSNLVILSLNGTSITGPIRDSFEPFTSLQFLDLSNCRLTGTIPRSLFDVPTIEFIYLHGNFLDGVIPDNYANPAQLRDLYLFNNDLQGTVPRINPGQLTQLSELLLEDNELTGEVPPSVCSLIGSDDGNLLRLTTDCAGTDPEITCDCCTACQ